MTAAETAALRDRGATNGVQEEIAEFMMLALSIVLGVFPLLGIVWTVKDGTITTVDGMFLSLILLTLSGILFLNAFLDVHYRLKPKAPDKKES